MKILHRGDIKTVISAAKRNLRSLNARAKRDKKFLQVLEQLGKELPGSTAQVIAVNDTTNEVVITSCADNHLFSKFEQVGTSGEIRFYESIEDFIIYHEMPDFTVMNCNHHNGIDMAWIAVGYFELLSDHRMVNIIDSLDDFCIKYIEAWEQYYGRPLICRDPCQPCGPKLDAYLKNRIASQMFI
jgi:hypothetical protein